MAPSTQTSVGSADEVGAGFKEQPLGIDTEGVEESEEVLSAEDGVGQGEGQCGGDEAPTVLHHPCPSAPLHRCGLAHPVHDGVPCRQMHRPSFWGVVEGQGESPPASTAPGLPWCSCVGVPGGAWKQGELSTPEERRALAGAAKAGADLDCAWSQTAQTCCLLHSPGTVPCPPFQYQAGWSPDARHINPPGVATTSVRTSAFLKHPLPCQHALQLYTSCIYCIYLPRWAAVKSSPETQHPLPAYPVPPKP